MKIYDVFISYRRSDGLIIAEALYKYLTSKGLRVFFDKHEMIDGHYFTTQIETNLKIAPNYILVATDDVFKFREKEDWVRKEIEVAIEKYESNPIERTLTVLVPESVTFPEKEALPQSVCNIADAQRIALPYGEDFAEPFYKTLKTVTNINRRNLWFAAHRWLENIKQPGGRFASLNITESILPNASKNKIEQKAMPINVYSKDKENKNRQSLLDAMGCNGNHLYLIGQGGIGKTTALMHIMNNAYVDKQYSENAQIPLFVELSFAPDTYGALYEGGKSSFIRRSIYKQVRADRTIKQVTAKEVSDVDEVFSSLHYDVAVQPITDILSKTTPAPEYLLLLDGLNEVSSVTVEETGLSVIQMIIREIDLLISECPNVRVVLTSRSDEAAIYNESISRLYLSGVEDSTIKDYLESFELSKEQIDKVLEDENLNETLQIPLFLTMYASLSKYDEVSTQGEILKLFFNERRKNISVYTMQERLSQVEKNITDVASAVQKNRIDADMQNFILDFILPEIAWFLERNGEFYLSVRSIRKIVEPILTDTDDLAVCGEFGREIFSKYRNGASAKMHTYEVANRIFERLGDDITEVAESIINCCVFALGVMQESNGKYGFVHQHIRDYFAALKNINTIRLSVYLYEENEKELALECMNKAFKDEPVNYTIRRFMGEYLGEHRNKPYFANEKWNYGVPAEECDRNLVKRAFSIYRGCLKGECGYGVYSLISLLKEIRTDLFKCDFSNLDMTKCEFESINLNFCDFQKSVFSPSSFFPASILLSNIDDTSISAISKDGKYVALVSQNGIYIVDIALNVVISVYDCSLWKNFSSIKKVIFFENDLLIVVFNKTFAIFTLNFELVDLKMINNSDVCDFNVANISTVVSNLCSNDIDNFANIFLKQFTDEEMAQIYELSKMDFDTIEKLFESENNSQENILVEKVKKLFLYKQENTLLINSIPIDFFSQANTLDVFLVEQTPESFSLIVLFDGKLFKLNYEYNENDFSCKKQYLGCYDVLRELRKTIVFNDRILFLKDKSYQMLHTENLECDILWISLNDYKLKRHVFKHKKTVPINALYNYYFSTDMSGIKIKIYLWDHKFNFSSFDKTSKDTICIYYNYKENDVQNKKYISFKKYKEEIIISDSLFYGNKFFLTHNKANKKISLYAKDEKLPFENDKCCWSIETHKFDRYNSVFMKVKNNEKYIIIGDYIYKINGFGTNCRIQLVDCNADVSSREIYEKHKCILDYDYDLYEQLCNEFSKDENFVKIEPVSYKYPVFIIEKKKEPMQYVFVNNDRECVNLGHYGDLEVFDDYLFVNSKSANVSICSLKENCKLVKDVDLSKHISPLISESAFKRIQSSNLHMLFNIHNLSEKNGVFYLSVRFGNRNGNWTFKLFAISNEDIKSYPNEQNKVFSIMKNVEYASNVIQLNGVFFYIEDQKLCCFEPFQNNKFTICNAEIIRMFSDGLFITINENIISVWDINEINTNDACSIEPITKIDASYVNYSIDGCLFTKNNGMDEHLIEQLRMKGAIFFDE